MDFYNFSDFQIGLLEFYKNSTILVLWKCKPLDFALWVRKIVEYLYFEIWILNFFFNKKPHKSVVFPIRLWDQKILQKLNLHYKFGTFIKIVESLDFEHRVQEISKKKFILGLWTQNIVFLWGKKILGLLNWRFLEIQESLTLNPKIWKFSKKKKKNPRILKICTGFIKNSRTRVWGKTRKTKPFLTWM